MADFNQLPLFTDSYLADTTHLSDAEHGIYCLLLIHTWRTPGCRLPNDPKWISRKMGRSVEAFENAVLPIMREFFDCNGNWWTQKRLTKEHNYVRSKSTQQSSRAKARWQKEKAPCENDAAPHASGISPHTHTHTHTKESDSVELTTPQAGEQAFEQWWDLYPKKVGRKKVAAKFFAILKRREATVDEMMNGLERHREMWRIEGTAKQYIPNPETWLNQGRWEDDLGPPDPKGTVAAINGQTAVHGGATMETWVDRVTGYRSSGFWLDGWGFPPDDPLTQIPQEALDAGN